MAKYQLRKTALEILVRVGENGGFSHLLIDQAIRKQGFDQRDEALLTEIVYGTIQRKLTLAYFLDHFLNSRKKIDGWVRWLLYMSMYQMNYLSKVPDHAIIHESVEIAKQKGHQGISSFVNGILRTVQRNGFPDISKIEDQAKKLSIETSHPLWLVERWLNMYGTDTTVKMCRSNLQHKPISVRVQPMKITREEALQRLEEEGYQVESSIFSPQGINVISGNVLKSSLFRTGKLTIQDQTSMLAAEILSAGPEMTVLDACSAPGGKTTHIAEKMNNRGEVHAYDLHSKKAKLVSKRAVELDLTIIEAKQADSRKLAELYEPEHFDRILLDAPCSGFGVLRGKPDIKYHKNVKDIETLSVIQRELLENVASLLKKGGKLVYSTCTVDKAENETVVKEFLAGHEDFQVDRQFVEELPEVLQKGDGISDWGLQIFPYEFDTDGFFLTRLTKN
ncbi:16S rRNA (cytosine(967)-C(5))-methyltransferase RsmB [Sediminibacillus halophilus]|uniref:16S rRNA (cytosine(967)-C(5))-methyltransferase n=1 Tax=Sediminibacillus halophilus TaxID=482461 RepID=A0A1G9MNQ0_9BACI|nr:16S rRNA (cytosine(967)-C(5))-methyltransferase RsmB [Sediminibacillus halophilus]SDL75537.1 16S rRNA (cytosine967-C5)-methyltransferase [Sediminibacillus halophilus]